jgi:hypothetical protein
MASSILKPSGTEPMIRIVAEDEAKVKARARADAGVDDGPAGQDGGRERHPGGRVRPEGSANPDEPTERERVGDGSGGDPAGLVDADAIPHQNNDENDDYDDAKGDSGRFYPPFHCDHVPDGLYMSVGP